MQWLYDAHIEITERDLPELRIRYSGRFRGFNANVQYGRGWMEFSLSKNWKIIDEDIKKGLIQHLLCKVYRIRKKTLHIELYEEFLRQASNYAPRNVSDPFLEERFELLNEEYFSGTLEQPNLRFGQFSTTKLGSYEYGTDTVTISTALKDDTDMLDYVLYHELLHKKHKFTCSGGQSRHHTKAFRDDEKLFRVPDAEKRLTRYIAIKRREKHSRKKPARGGLFAWLR